MKTLRLLIFLVACLLVSCNNNEPVSPYTYKTNPKYTWGYVQFFGDEYADYNIKNNILSVSLFSDSLSIDSTGTLQGLGQFLYLDDVYIAPTDTILPLGTYTISNSHAPFSVLPGKNDTIGTEIFPIGAYITYYEENSAKSTMKFISEGTFTVSYTSGKFNIACNFKTADKKTLTGNFNGVLPHFDESLQRQRLGVSRKQFFPNSSSILLR